jgi:tetratricopeptide (TPR) repeat protein
VPARLDELHAVGVLLRIEGARGLSFRFKHALVRDAAYESILEGERRAMHETVAAVLRDRFPALARERPEHLAQHLTAAGRLDEALETWESAARVAASRSENLEAIAHARTAMALLPRLAPTPWRDQCELRLQVLLASRLIASDGYGAEPVERAYLRAQALARQVGDAAVQAKIALGLEAYYFMRANFARARSMAELAYAEAQDSADPMQRMQANWALANVHWHQGRLVPALDLMDRCLDIYRPQFHRPSSVQDPGVMCLCYSAWACWERGDAPEARRRVQQVLALAQSLGHRFSQGQAAGFAASVLMFCGDHEAALAQADRAIEICDGAGFAVWLAHAVITRGRLRAQIGAVDEGCAEMQRGYAMWVRTGAMVTRPYYLTLQAEGRLLAGRPDEAEPLLQEALRIADAGGEHYHSAEVLRLLGDVAAARGEPQAQGLRRQAYEQAHAQGKRVFALRAALAWARGARPDGQALSAVRLAVSELPAPADYPEAAAAASLLAGVVQAAPAGPHAAAPAGAHADVSPAPGTARTTP